MLFFLCAFVVLSKVGEGEFKTYPVNLYEMLDDNELRGIYNNFYTISDASEENIISHIHQKVSLSKKVPYPHEVLHMEPSNLEETYLLVKTRRHRDKRYISSYLTLCHFKICNMGRKRTARYSHMIKTLGDNET